jgi:hypothetical protein
MQVLKRVLLSMYGSRRDVEPMVGLAVQPGAEECDARRSRPACCRPGVWR